MLLPEENKEYKLQCVLLSITFMGSVCLPCILINRGVESKTAIKSCAKTELEANPACADAKDAFLRMLDSDAVVTNQKSSQKICEDIKSCKYFSDQI